MTDQGGSGAGASMDMAKLMQDIAASGEIEVPDQVEFNGTLYIRATHVAQLRAALEAAQAEAQQAVRLNHQLAAECVERSNNELTLQAENTRLTRELEATRGVVEAAQQDRDDFRSAHAIMRNVADRRKRQRDELRAENQAMHDVVEAARMIRSAKEALMRQGWAAHSQDTNALQALFGALQALDAAQAAGDPLS